MTHERDHQAAGVCPQAAQPAQPAAPTLQQWERHQAEGNPLHTYAANLTGAAPLPTPATTVMFEAQPAQAEPTDAQRCIDARNRLNALLHGDGAVIDSLEDAVLNVGAELQRLRAAQAEPQPVAPVTLADVLDALNMFNRPKPNEDDGPWEGGHYIRVDHLPSFINIIAKARFAAPTPAQPAAEAHAATHKEQ